MTYQKGTLKATIWVRSIIFNDEIQLYRIVSYEVDTTVNGLELWIEKPNIPNAKHLEEDIYRSACEELRVKRFDNVNYLKL